MERIDETSNSQKEFVMAYPTNLSLRSTPSEISACNDDSSLSSREPIIRCGVDRDYPQVASGGWIDCRVKIGRPT